MAGTIIADSVNAASSSTLVLKNGVANTPPTIQDSNGTQVGTFCRAWVNFNGTGTVAIRASFNVSSITDNGTGDYTVNFTNALPDANYGVFYSGQRSTSASDFGFTKGYSSTTTSVRALTSGSTGTQTDWEAVTVSVFR